MNSEALYLKLPIPLQNAACSLVGWCIQRSRFGPGFYEQLRQYEERARWSHDRMHSYRDQRLAQFIRHCAATVPYYRDLFRELDIAPECIVTLDDLAKLPILTKPVVQKRYPDLLSAAVPPHQRIITHTSGTTGGGLRFAVTLAAIQEQWAAWWRYRRMHGLTLDTWSAHFGGRLVVPLAQKRPPFWRYNRPGRQILFSGYHLSPATMRLYVDELNRRRPPWWHGYPSILALLAGFVLETRSRLAYQPRWITIGAENLLSQQVDLIERAFGVRPIEHYGMAEACANVSQCPRGRLHVDEDFAATEFVPSPAGGCKVVGTNFTNPATPLLRYDAGDVVQPSDESCDCGLPGRTLRRIDGRKEDYVILRNGARLGRMDHIFKDLMAIREAQIYQNQPGVIIVRIVKNPSYTERFEGLLKAEFYKRVGDEAEVRVEYVDNIARTVTGKLRLVVSDIKDGQIVTDS